MCKYVRHCQKHYQTTSNYKSHVIPHIIIVIQSRVPVICFRLARASDLYAPTSNSCISTPIQNWTHVYVNLFTRNSPYCHLPKYLLFLLKHSVYSRIMQQHTLHNSVPARFSTVLVSSGRCSKKFGAVLYHKTQRLL